MKSLASRPSEGTKVLVLSDIHGNMFGLEAAIDEGRDCDYVLCLGDIVGYGAHPNECCEVLRGLGAVCLAGNHDAAAIGEIDIQWFNPIAKTAILWTRDQLTPENQDWLRTLPDQGAYPAEDFQFVHASLRQPQQEYIVAPNVAVPTLDLMTTSVCFYGHTHEADVYRYLNVAGEKLQIQRKSLAEGGRFDLKSPSKYLINPGSCGQPRDGNPLAKFAIFDSASRKVEIKAVDYDYFAAAAAIQEAGLPQPLADRLFLGK